MAKGKNKTVINTYDWNGDSDSNWNLGNTPPLAMNTETALILRDDAAGTILWTETANTLKSAALELSGIIGKVNDADTNSQAVTAQIEIRRVLKLSEAARVEAKRPLIDLGKVIEDAVKTFIIELKAEEWRLSKMVGDYQQLLAAQARAAAQAEANRLKGIEDARQAELARCQTHEQLDAVNEKHNEIAAQQPVPEPPKAAPKVQGQIVQEVWTFEVTDIWALARAHPSMVKIEPRAMEIKVALRAGVTLAGVTGRKEITATVRVPTGPKAIDV